MAVRAIDVNEKVTKGDGSSAKRATTVVQMGMRKLAPQRQCEWITYMSPWTLCFSVQVKPS